MMKRQQMVWVSSLTVAASLVAGSFAAAQEVKRQTTTTEVETEAGTKTTTRTTEIRRVSTVVGGTVQFSDGATVGKIEDIIISDGGCIDYVIVKYEDQFVPIPWHVANVNYSNRIVRLNMDRTRFREVPTFASGDFRVFSDAAFTRRVNTFFDVDVNIRDDRRGDRRGRDLDGDNNRRDRDDRNRRDGDDRRESTNDRTLTPTPEERKPANRDRDPELKDKPAERPAPGSPNTRPATPATPRERDLNPAIPKKEVNPKETTPKEVPPTTKPPVPSKPETPAPK